MTEYFVTEIMMTAGPRKRFMSEEYGDKDLGEDVCGFIGSNEKMMVWLLDGTSDLHCLIDPVSKKEYFSSRLLATGIAGKLRKYFLKSGFEHLNETITQCINEVKEDWVSNLEKLPEREKQFLRKNIVAKNYPECAATVLIAGLEINGELTAYRSGDSKTLLFDKNSNGQLSIRESPLSEKNDESNDRIFFRVMLDEQERFMISSNDPLYEIVKESKINTIIAFSDGVSQASETIIRNSYGSDPEGTRNRIIWQSQQTGDDKSICLVEIISINN